MENIRRYRLFVFVIAMLVCLGMLSSVYAKDIKIVDRRYKLKVLVPNTPFAGVNGATIGADGKLYVTHTGNGTITKIDLEKMGFYTR